MKVFLGGTCNSSLWREDLIPLLNVDYFNPVVEDWTPECQVREIKEREECDYVLYGLTPRMVGVYSIAELIDDSNKRPSKTMFVILNDKDDDGVAVTFIPTVKKSMDAVAAMAMKNGAMQFASLKDVAFFLNGEAVRFPYPFK
jgi:hypothetical protein